MTAKVVRSPASERDLAEIAAFLAERSLQVALRFLDQAQSAVDRLADMPEIGGVYEPSRGTPREVRIWPIPGFEKYLIVYRTTASGIAIVRVLHGAQNLGDQLNP